MANLCTRARLPDHGAATLDAAPAALRADHEKRQDSEVTRESGPVLIHTAPRPPRFSIVTPSYNQRPFIAETIESVLSQEGSFEVEYFVMDGGSTDGSVEVIKHYAERVAAGEWPAKCRALSLTWVSQRDRGQSDAINEGLRRTTGEFASYINSDDAYFPGAFARIAAEFAAHPDAHLIYGDGDVIDAAGQRQWEWLSRPYDHSVMTSYHFLWNDFSNYIMQQATFWRTSVMGRIGYFDETFQYAMDVEYWVRAAHAGLMLHHMPHKLGKFRLIPGTKSRSSPTVFWPDHLEIYRRYRGSRSLAPYFGYYYYNLAQQLSLDPEQARCGGRAVFDRWRALPHDEQRVITQQAERGHALACLLLAADLHGQRRGADARASFRRAVAHSPWLALHPFAWRYLVTRIVGR
ncbi:MAG: hypothetical protein A3J75_01120, partial [Acidobacteria bacterium RBG_16_68_9]